MRERRAGGSSGAFWRGIETGANNRLNTEREVYAASFETSGTMCDLQQLPTISMYL